LNVTQVGLLLPPVPSTVTPVARRLPSVFFQPSAWAVWPALISRGSRAAPLDHLNFVPAPV
jgi:hypothetical protein